MIDGFTFRQAVWLFPPAFILHVVEEWPQFTRWVQTHASGQFSRRDYNAIHVAGIFSSVLGATLVWLFPNPAVVLLFFTFLLPVLVSTPYFTRAHPCSRELIARAS